ncbi:MAG TPA: HlyD family secretion protein [Stellaceae bacterium]|nr:HlyD family secretion protein [Stellaceae bacterium]
MSTIEADRGAQTALREEKARPPREDAPQDRAPRRRPWYRRPLVLALLVLLAIALVIGGVLWWLDASRYETTDDAFIDAHIVRVAPRVAGRVLRVLAEDNADVQAGQVLVELDPRDLQAALDQAKAAAASASGKLAQAEAQQKVAAANLDEAKAEVGVAEANAANAATELRRLQSLAKSRSPALSQQQLDTATANAKSTAATLNAAQKKAAAAEAQTGLAASQVATARADREAAQAQLEAAQLNRSYATVTAPEAGHVTNRTVAVGDYVQAGQNLMALVPHKLWITANFKETQLDRMRPGQKVDITIDAYPGTTFHGHVDSIQRGSGAAFSLLPPENATGNFVKVVQRVPVKIVFDGPLDPQYALGPGMSVEPSVEVR